MRVASYEEWLKEREALLVREKAWTVERDEISKQRQALPAVKIEKQYTLESIHGPQSLLQLFEDQSQLIVYHFMFGADWQSTCVGCTSWAEAFDGTTEKFAKVDARLIAVSTAPPEKLEAEKQKRGWRFDWYSQQGSDFGVDFHASSLTGEETRQVGNQLIEFDRGENHAITVFQRNGDDIYMTYNTLNRGVEPMNGAYAYYDLLPKGRQW